MRNKEGIISATALKGLTNSEFIKKILLWDWGVNQKAFSAKAKGQLKAFKELELQLKDSFMIWALELEKRNMLHQGVLSGLTIAEFAANLGMANILDDVMTVFKHHNLANTIGVYEPGVPIARRNGKKYAPIFVVFDAVHFHRVPESLAIECLDVFKKHGADLFAVGEDGASLVQYATWGRSHFKVWEWVMKQGLDVNTKNPEGVTALHDAMRYGSVEFIQAVIQSGADVEAVASAYQGIRNVSIQKVISMRAIDNNLESQEVKIWGEGFFKAWQEKSLLGQCMEEMPNNQHLTSQLGPSNRSEDLEKRKKKKTL